LYCRDNNRRGSYEHTAFTFLGFTFRPRIAKDRGGETFTAFMPAVSPEALKTMGRQARRWRMHMWVRHDLNELARQINPIVAGWMNYYGRFYRPRMPMDGSGRFQERHHVFCQARRAGSFARNEGVWGSISQGGSQVIPEGSGLVK
jgi:RNA-directed DNA polymerase